MCASYWSVLFLFLVAMPASAQEPEYGPRPWSLQFQVTENFTLSEFQGSVVSVKYHSSERSAWRAGLEMYFTSDSRDLSSTTSSSSDLDRSVESSGYETTLNLQYLRYANSSSRMRLFYGGGPFTGFANSESESVQTTVTNKTEYHRWSYGISGIVGVEWFVASNVGVHAEYGLEFGYATAESKASSNDRESKSDSEAVRLSSRGVLLGLSAYF